MTAAAVLSAVAPAAQVRRVMLHHIGQRRDPGVLAVAKIRG
jgi:hypothetical protein